MFQVGSGVLKIVQNSSQILGVMRLYIQEFQEILGVQGGLRVGRESKEGDWPAADGQVYLASTQGKEQTDLPGLTGVVTPGGFSSLLASETAQSAASGGK